MLVGEQPGNEEDLKGLPFVGPAGTLLDGLIHEAGLERGRLYVTNAVKHFSFVDRGQRRLHKKPTTTEIAACKPWLLGEIEAVQPVVVVLLGATATYALLGARAKLTRDRGQLLPLTGVPSDRPRPTAALITFHPAAVLRAPTPERRRALRQMLLSDLRTAAEAAQQVG